MDLGALFASLRDRGRESVKLLSRSNTFSSNPPVQHSLTHPLIYLSGFVLLATCPSSTRLAYNLTCRRDQSQYPEPVHASDEHRRANTAYDLHN